MIRWLYLPAVSRSAEAAEGLDGQVIGPVPAQDGQAMQVSCPSIWGPTGGTRPRGFAVAFGVLLDTIVVRSILVTALNLDLGDRMWWPGRLSRRPLPPEPHAPAREPMSTIT